MEISSDAFQKLKYSENIKSLIENKGTNLPDDLESPRGEIGYRYAFKNDQSRSHLPIYIMKPQRAIQKNDSRTTTSGYALSCLTTREKAIAFFSFIKKSNKKVKETIGDILTNGILDSEDGLVTLPDEHGHFDLYEYRTCNLHSKFVGETDL